MLPLEPGRVLGGKYVLRERIGEGGMGIVYLADQPALARTVAIKSLRPELAVQREHVRRLHAEALAASRVCHPGSVRVFDCAVLADGTPYIVMEHVRGRSLARVVAEDDVPPPRAIGLALQILSALDAVHGSGVVHADVKCDNFLVEQVAGADHVTLIDFGLARVDGEDASDGQRLVSGTPEYMAPEVIRGERPRPASDLYATGVILYELLTGKPPFSGGTAAEIMASQLDDLVIPPSLRANDRELSPALDHIVLRALAKEPAARYATADELARALRAARVARMPPSGHPPRPHDVTSSDSPTRACSPPKPRLARGSSCRGLGHAELRRAIGDALRCGDVVRIADGYLALAGALAEGRQLGAAASELEEGIDVLSTTSETGAIDRLVVALAALYDEAGACDHARHAAATADRHPTLANV